VYKVLVIVKNAEKQSKTNVNNVCVKPRGINEWLIKICVYVYTASIFGVFFILSLN